MSEYFRVFFMAILMGNACVASELLCQLDYLRKSLFMKHLSILTREAVSHPTVIQDLRDRKGYFHPKMAYNQSLYG